MSFKVCISNNLRIDLNWKIPKFFQYGLTRGLFEKLIEARDLFVEDDARPPFFSMEDVDIYSGKVPFIYYIGIVT